MRITWVGMLSGSRWVIPAEDSTGSKCMILYLFVKLKFFFQEKNDNIDLKIKTFNRLINIKTRKKINFSIR